MRPATWIVLGWCLAAALLAAQATRAPAPGSGPARPPLRTLLHDLPLWHDVTPAGTALGSASHLAVLAIPAGAFGDEACYAGLRGPAGERGEVALLHAGSRRPRNRPARLMNFVPCLTAARGLTDAGSIALPGLDAAIVLAPRLHTATGAVQFLAWLQTPDGIAADDWQAVRLLFLHEWRGGSGEGLLVTLAVETPTSAPAGVPPAVASLAAGLARRVARWQAIVSAPPR